MDAKTLDLALLGFLALCFVALALCTLSLESRRWAPFILRGGWGSFI